MFFNLDRLLNRAWKEKALKKGHIDLIVSDSAIEASRKVGGPTTKRPMKDISDSICEAIYEEFEPPLRYLPYFEKPIQVIIPIPTTIQIVVASLGTGVVTPIPGTPVLVSHNLGRTPRGYIVTQRSGGFHVISDKLSWNPVTMLFSAEMIANVPTPVSFEVIVF